MPKLVLDLKDRRPAWALPPWVAEEIRNALPSDWEMAVIESPADGSGDGVALVSDELLAAIGDATVYLGYGIPAQLLREGPELRWVHSGAAGVRGSLTPEMLASDVIFTNSAGIHGPPIAETVVAMILHFGRSLDRAVAAQARGEWDKDAFIGAGSTMVELSAATVGILGFGGIGREIARRVGALGARVLGLDRESGEVSDPTATVSQGTEGFHRLMEESDYVVVAAPETEHTRGMVNGEALARVKEGAVLINISRGNIVEEEALLEALESGRLRGAALDVFAQEPLPEHHPFWKLPNVLITPHVSAVTPLFWRRQADLILENLRRFLADEELKNVVDKEAGF